MRGTIVALALLAGCATSEAATPTTTTTEADTTTTFTLPPIETLPTTTAPAPTTATTVAALDLPAIETSIRDYYAGTRWGEQITGIAATSSTLIVTTTATTADHDAWCGVAKGWIATNGANHGVTAWQISGTDGPIATATAHTCT